MLKTEAIKQVLDSSGNRHLTDLYTPGMEVQVNVAQDDGEPVRGTTFTGVHWRGWQKGEDTWKSFRIPWNANADAQYTDKPITFNLARHVEGIGMTGWNWVVKQSQWFGFDFDSIANHKQGLSLEELDLIKAALLELPYATVVKSTSGKGLHLYVHLNTPVYTQTHTEHAALARAILSVISTEIGFNFLNSVDTCGGVLWVYHRKQEGTDGLSLLKQGNKFDTDKIPSNWKDHIEVTSGKRRKIKSISQDETLFDELVSSIKQAKLDPEHQILLKWFSSASNPSGVTGGPDRDWWWDNDHHMLVCHTLDLAKAHKTLNCKGVFYTNSSGSSSQNCYAFPTTGGSWTIRRHSLGVKEHPSWTTDSSGWTKCVFNTIADFQSCCRSNEGTENVKGDYVFSTTEKGLLALKDLGLSIEMPYTGRSMTISEKLDGKVVLSIPRESSDLPIPGWLTNKKGDRWEMVVYRTKQKKEVSAPDYLIRHIISNNAEAGWYIFTRKKWTAQARSNVITVLLGQQAVQNRQDTELLMCRAILDPWELVNIPFEEEYPGDRRWNKDAASFSVTPELGKFPNWLKVLAHCGKALDEEVDVNKWCSENSIFNGAEYLMCWVANSIQRPYEPLPYLFFCGEQNSGKSTLHEALALLFTNSRGYIRADNALINQAGFNAELANAVICVVEETDLRKNKDAGNRIKDWVTGQTISINTKYKTVYDIKNTCHWIQCSNDLQACPVLPGDTRIIVIWVNKPTEEIPKAKLFLDLERERAAFLYHILNLELPEPESRLALPIIKTAEKMELEYSNSTEIEQFMKEETKQCNGHYTAYEDFYYAFLDWLPADRRNYWSKNRMARYFPKTTGICKGKLGINNTTIIGNCTLDKTAEPEAFEYFPDKDNRINRRGVTHD